MSDSTATPAEPTAQPTPQAPAQEPQKVEETDWKAEARKWETRAKENKDAAERLAQIEDAQKTAEQRAAEREAAATKRAEEAEARALRREIALDPTGDGKSAPLSKEDAALLDEITDEAAMRKFAARLASRAQGNLSPDEGNTPTPKSDDMRAFTRDLFSRAAGS